MNVSPYQIQNVIRAYGQRVSRKGLMKLELENGSSSPDKIDISDEAKQRFIAQKVATEIISKVKGDSTTDPRIGAYLAEKVSKELGGKLDVVSDQTEGGGLKFRVIDPQRGEIIKELSTKDAEELIMRAYSKIEKIGT